jgi:hypothetical protein
MLATMAALLLAAPAEAAPGQTYRVAGGSIVFGLGSGTNGYRVHFAEWERGRGTHFKVGVEGHHATMSYAVPTGRSPADGIVGNLGRRGRFDLHLVQLGQARRLGLGRGCEGEHGRWQRGYALGSAHFRGERDYTELSARRFPIVIESWPDFRCHYAEGGARHGSRRRAQVFADDEGVGFGAVLASRHSGPAARRATFRAWDSDHIGRMWIYREVKIPAPEASFTFPGGPKLPEVVTVEPPQPFSGSASFTRTPESTFAWSGDLTVEFPGLDPIRLAGPRFRSGVCAADRCVSQEPEREPPT